MAIHLLQVTLGAAPTQFTATRTPCRAVTVQNNAANSMRVGDKNTTSTKGIALAASGAANSLVKFGPHPAQNLNLEDFWVAGTNAQVLDVAYET